MLGSTGKLIKDRYFIELVTVLVFSFIIIFTVNEVSEDLHSWVLMVEKHKLGRMVE